MMELSPTPTVAHPLATWVVRYRYPVMAVWLTVAVLLRLFAPTWESLAYDGDFDFLPIEMPSVAGGLLLDQAFPEERRRSEIVIVVAREDQPLTEADDFVALDLQRRLAHRFAEVSIRKARDLGWRDGLPDLESREGGLLKRAKDALDEAIDADEKFFEKFIDCLPRDREPTVLEPRMAIAYWDRSRLLTNFGDLKLSRSDRQAALALVPNITEQVIPINDRDLDAWSPMIGLLSWNDAVLGHRLRNKHARLIRIQLESDFSATGNIATFEAVEQMIEQVRQHSGSCTEPGLQVLPTGSGAIGAQTLIAARDAIRYTEWFTVLLVLCILACVYRAPLLVLIPLMSIGCAVICASGLVALLALYAVSNPDGWFDLRIFTTSKIFVVVILFGAGTDYCLFLIARLREEAVGRPWTEACAVTLTKVTPALLGSALTTVLGLSMLWIASFGKFQHTGPVIGLCLMIGLVTSLTLTPALLCICGPRVFWPNQLARLGTQKRRVWTWLALVMTRYPAVTLALGLGLLSVPAGLGYFSERAVTYDISGQLSATTSSRQGLELLTKYFSIGDSNPTTLLLVHREAVSREKLIENVNQLRQELYRLPGVVAVRTLHDPLGEFHPERRMSLIDSQAWRRRLLREHPIAQRHFFSETEQFANRLVRVDVVVQGDPFDTQTAEIVDRLGTWLQSQIEDPRSVWYDSSFALSGTTASIIDLKAVTLQDNQRIKWAVVGAVFSILLLVVRRFWLSVYLILTVLLSYYATVGITYWFFRWLYGPTFLGLDWKLPLFLFVILVAVGQDYNVYLVTRVLEEQKRRGWLSALRRAVSRTGGIITACGIVMAATFFSMTSSAVYPWLLQSISTDSAPASPVLQGIVQLGFALGLGVIIDTFIVRTFLVPSFITLTHRCCGPAKQAAGGDT